MRKKILIAALILMTISIGRAGALTLESLPVDSSFGYYKSYLFSTNKSLTEIAVSALQAGTLTAGLDVSGGTLVLSNDAVIDNYTTTGVMSFRGSAANLGSNVFRIVMDSLRSYTNVADGDGYFFDVEAKNDSNETYKVARWTYNLADVSSNSEDTVVSLDIPIAGVLTRVLTANASGISAPAGFAGTLQTNAIVVTDYGTFGGAVTAVTLTATSSISAPDLTLSDDLIVGDDARVDGLLTAADSAVVNTNLSVGKALTVGGDVINTPTETYYTGANVAETVTVASALMYVQTAGTNTWYFNHPLTKGKTFEIWNVCSTNIHIPTSTVMRCGAEITLGFGDGARFRALTTNSWGECWTIDN